MEAMEPLPSVHHPAELLRTASPSIMQQALVDAVHRQVQQGALDACQRADVAGLIFLIWGYSSIFLLRSNDSHDKICCNIHHAKQCAAGSQQAVKH